jgi:hypothetical protein
MLSDLAVVKAARATQSMLTEKPEVPVADPAANGDGTDAKSKGDPKVLELEAKKHELNDELAQLQKELDKKAEAAQRDLRKRIADVDHALEKAHSGH